MEKICRLIKNSPNYSLFKQGGCYSAYTHACTHAHMHAHLATAVKQLQSEGMFNSLLKM